MRILLLESDDSLARFLRKQLESEDYSVDIAGDGDGLETILKGRRHDLVVLDVPSPMEHNLRLIKEIRARMGQAPMMILSTTDEVDERIRALDLGADDYLLKPFASREFLARIRALLRRCRPQTTSILRVEDLEMDRIGRVVARSGKRIDLTPKEFALLEYLMVNTGRRVTRAMIARDVWNFSPDAMTNVVEVYINYVRNKIDRGFELKLIHTIRGVGYQLGGEEDADWPLPYPEDAAETALTAQEEPQRAIAPR